MASYLLLRDNKQNGPFTFEELKAKGLKAYDLVWVEGKSAAWRYPGEIEELKPFSPPVVEQPFDRFFKRNPVANKPNEPVLQSQGLTEKAEKAIYQQASLQTAKGNVYVTLPQRKIPVQEMGVGSKNAPELKEPAIKKEVPSSNPLKENATRVTVVANAGEALTQNKTQPKPLQTGRQGSPKKNILSDKYLKILYTSLGIILLLTTGIFIGLSINKPGTAVQAKMDNPIQGSNTNAVIPVSANLKEQKPENTIQENQEASRQNQAVDKNSQLLAEKKKNNPLKKVNPDTSQKTLVISQTKDSNNTASFIPGAHREAIHRNEGDVLDKEAIKNTLVNLVSISTNKYNVGTFGGISELQLTVSNRSVHPLDLVIVEIRYLQANKKTFKTENLYFHNINAGESIMQEAPKSPRGIKIETRITVINGREPGLSYSGL